MLDRMLLDKLPELEQTAVPVALVVEHIAVVAVHIVVAVEHIVVAVHIVVRAASVVVMPVVLLLGSIVDIILGPCMLSSRLCKSIYHSGCIHILLASWGGRNTDLVMEPGRVRLR